MSMAHDSTAGTLAPLTLALTFGGNQLYLVGRHEAPLWMRRYGPWRRSVKVRWHRIDQIPGHWWLGQSGRSLVVLGQGPRPPLKLRRVGDAWQGLVPPGRQSIVVTLPDSSLYEVVPVGVH